MAHSRCLFIKVHLLGCTNFFSDLQSHSFLIVCYILYPDPYLQKKGQPPNITENITLKQKETFFYTSMRAAQKMEAATGGVL